MSDFSAKNHASGGDASEKKRGGVLYGVGLGPGDPELMTLKAARLIASASVIAYPALVGGASLARSIAADVLPAGALEIVIEVPMTVERPPAQAAYDRGAAQVAEHLNAGRDVVYLCEGDPFFYGSFMYLFARLSGQFMVEIVPGVTSMTAVAARAARPMVARNEVLTVVPGPLPQAELVARIRGADSIVFMKVGRHLEKLRTVLLAEGLLDNAVYVERVGMAQEVCLPLAQAPKVAPYFSMILVTKGADPWL
ncbi:MAG: precorrin-2 C(20)-methyltransferase [Paracoccaceae bacterium]